MKSGKAPKYIRVKGQVYRLAVDSATAPSTSDQQKEHARMLQAARRAELWELGTAAAALHQHVDGVGKTLTTLLDDDIDEHMIDSLGIRHQLSDLRTILTTIDGNIKELVKPLKFLVGKLPVH